MMMQYIKDIPFHKTISKKKLKKVFHIVFHTDFFSPPDLNIGRQNMMRKDLARLPS
jgi:hypothetical protein